MSITAFQVNGGLVSPLADRKLYSFLSNDDVGILIGTSECIANGHSVIVTSGWGIIKGCVFRIVQEEIPIEVVVAGETKFFQLGIRLNLAASGTDSVMEFFVDSANSPGDLRPLVQQDINAGGQLYEFRLKQFTANQNGVVTGPSTLWNNSKVPYIVGATGHYPISPNENPSSFPRVDIIFRDGLPQAFAYDGSGEAGYSDTNVNDSYHNIIDSYGTFFPRIGELRGGANGTGSNNQVASDGVPKNTYFSVGSVTVGPGRWVINAAARFKKTGLTDAQTKTGYRQLFISGASPTGGTWSNAPSAINMFGNTIVAPIEKSDVFAHLTATYENQTGDDKTLYIGVYQDCGASANMTVESAKNIVRISDKDRWTALGTVEDDDNTSASNG